MRYTIAAAAVCVGYLVGSALAYAEDTSQSAAQIRALEDRIEQIERDNHNDELARAHDDVMRQINGGLDCQLYGRC